MQATIDHQSRKYRRKLYQPYNPRGKETRSVCCTRYCCCFPGLKIAACVLISMPHAASSITQQRVAPHNLWRDKSLLNQPNSGMDAPICDKLQLHTLEHCSTTGRGSSSSIWDHRQQATKYYLLRVLHVCTHKQYSVLPIRAEWYSVSPIHSIQYKLFIFSIQYCVIINTSSMNSTCN